MMTKNKNLTKIIIKTKIIINNNDINKYLLMLHMKMRGPKLVLRSGPNFGCQGDLENKMTLGMNHFTSS